jgi:hypothetical protein
MHEPPILNQFHALQVFSDILKNSFESGLFLYSYMYVFLKFKKNYNSSLHMLSP